MLGRRGPLRKCRPSTGRGDTFATVPTSSGLSHRLRSTGAGTYPCRKTENRTAAKATQAKKAKAVKERRPPRNKFYQSAEWKRVRYEALKRSHGRCECCGVSASMGAVLNVDHIKPISRRPDLSLELTNLQVLCGSCNQGKGGWDQTDWRGGHRMNELDKEYAAIMAGG